MTNETKVYGVSQGNGNNGVSQMFPNYYVRTNDPWNLARLAMVSQFKEEFQQHVANLMDIDGEAEYTISAVLYDPPEEEESTEDSPSWCEVNGAWMIIEIFPVPEDEIREGKPVYSSFEEAFDATDLKYIEKDS